MPQFSPTYFTMDKIPGSLRNIWILSSVSRSAVIFDTKWFCSRYTSSCCLTAWRWWLRVAALYSSVQLHYSTIHYHKPTILFLTAARPAACSLQPKRKIYILYIYKIKSKYYVSIVVPDKQLFYTLIMDIYKYFLKSSPLVGQRESWCKLFL